MHAVTSLFCRFMQANRNIHLCQEKAPILKLSHSKSPKIQQIRHYRHTRKTSELFLLFNTGVDFILRNNFANSSSFAKVSVPVHNYNSLIYTNIKCGFVSLLSPIMIYQYIIITHLQWTTIGPEVLWLCAAHALFTNDSTGRVYSGIP